MTKSCEDDGYGYAYGYEKEDDEDESSELSLDSIVTPTGEKLSLTVDISETDILADASDLYKRREADSEEEGEYTGNESMPTTLRYRNTVRFLSIST